MTAEVSLHEDREDFIRLMLADGQPLQGLYPMEQAWEARFRQWRQEQGRG